MNKTRTYFALMAIVIVVLASVSTYFSLKFYSNLEELHRSRVYQAYLAADDVYRKLRWFTGLYYESMRVMNASLRSSYCNETKVRVIISTCKLLEYYAERFWVDIKRDFSVLSLLAYHYKEIPFFNTTAYNTVYTVVSEALAQAWWAGTGKGDVELLNETPTLLWELYYLLGIDQNEHETPSKSKLEGLARCFYELADYWYVEYNRDRSNIPTDLTQPQTALEWVVGNATALHQELIQWDKYRPPPGYFY